MKIKKKLKIKKWSTTNNNLNFFKKQKEGENYLVIRNFVEAMSVFQSDG